MLRPPVGLPIRPCSWLLLASLLGASCKREPPALERQEPGKGVAALELVAAPRGAAPESDWVTVSPGSYRMGSALGEPCRDTDEAPVQVTLSRAFDVARLEVSQGDFEETMGYNPSFREDCSTCPVDSVSQHEAAAFCNALSQRAGYVPCYECSGEEATVRCFQKETPAACSGFRLPTEAEWEYAARGGTRSASPEGDVLSCMARDEAADRFSWYKANSEGLSQPGGSLNPNAWGIHDMAGNVYEWTSDWYAPERVGGSDPVGPAGGTLRVLRGGSWYHNAHHARLAKRLALPPQKRTSYTGFRCVRTLQPGN